MIKQRKESAKVYTEGKREDLAKREEKEIDIINSFLPHQITSDELDKILVEVISELECSSIKDLVKLIMFPPALHPKQKNKDLSLLTLKDGVFSL